MLAKLEVHLLPFSVIQFILFEIGVRTGILCFQHPTAVDDATATTALYLMLATLRQFPFAEHSLRQLKWKSKGISSKTNDITGRTIAILGLGGIATRVATLAHAFPMRVIYHSRRKNLEAPEYCEYFEDSMLNKCAVGILWYLIC